MGYANNIGYGLNNNSMMMGNSYNVPNEFSTAFRNTPINLYFNSDAGSGSNNASGFKQPTYLPFSGSSTNQNLIVSLLMQLMQLLGGNNMNSSSYYPNSSYIPLDQSLLSDNEKNSLYKEALSLGKQKPAENVVVDEPVKKPVENVVIDEPVKKPVENVVVDEPRSAAKKVYVFGNSDHGNNNDFWKDFKKHNFDGVLDKLSPEAEKAAKKYGKEMEGKSLVIDENGELIGIYKTTKLEDLAGVGMGQKETGKNHGTGTAKGKNITLDGQSLEIANNAWASPLAFDINGDGIKTKSSKISYDIDGDGKKDKINDVNDGILCVNGGKDGKDLFGDNTDIDRDGKADGKNGFESLKALALKEGLINGEDDMKLDKADIKKLEQKYDIGIKQGYKGKVKSLEDVGITEINLAKTDETETIDNFDKRDNKLMTQQGATFTVNGKEREYADVWHKKY